MNTRLGVPLYALATHLEQRRGVLVRRWIRAVRADPALERIRGLSVEQMFDGVPPILEEVAELLRSGVETAVPAARGDHARAHARARWRLGYRFDDLYRELDLFQRCLRQLAREFFSQGNWDRDVQAAAHQVIENFFSAATHAAIRRFVEEQSAHVDTVNRQRDDTARALERVEERLRMAASAAGLGIFEWHVPTKAGVWENRLMYAITGRPESLGPLSCHAFVRELAHPDDAEMLIRRYLQAMDSRDEFHCQFRIRRLDDGSVRYVEMHGRFRSDAHGAIESFVGTLADVTRRMLAEQSLQEADRKKDAFLATLAHELRNPLAPIRTAAAIIRKQQTVEGDDVHSIIERQCAHLARLIDDLLDVSRIGTGKIRLQRRTMDLRQAIRDAVEINVPKAREHGHAIELSLPDEPVWVDGDSTRLIQIFSNLLDNALKYSDDGKRVRLAAGVSQQIVQIVVADQGMGIPTSLLASLFEPYVQLAPASSRARSGLGIGLSVVRNLVDMHGGRVSALSEGEGRGSTFVVTLPLAAEAPSAAPSGVEPRPAAGQDGSAVRRILLVDDNHDALDAMAMLLVDHEIRRAADAGEALALVADFPAELAILDIDLPDMSGYELARELRKSPGMARAVFVALSGFGTPEDVARSRAEGFDHHFVKPVDPEELLRFLGDAEPGGAARGLN